MITIIDSGIEFLLYFVINISFILLISPFYMTLVKKVKAFAQRRRGPPLLQGYYNLGKLMKKEVIYSKNSSIIMRITPYINLITLLTATLSIPLIFVPQYFNDFGNVILFLYLLALAKFFMALSGLDAGSTFGGMGSSREMTVLAIFEPITIIVFGALVFALNTTDIYTMFDQADYCSNNIAQLSNSCHRLFPLLLPIAISLFIMLIVETARIPVDNPETHLELTMIHEAMVLEQSGPNLAMMELSHAIKQTLIMAILINIFFPYGLTTGFTPFSFVISLVSFFIKGIALAIVVGVFESSIAKFRLLRLPSLFVIALFLPLITIAISVLT